jgi:hypothetical protein
MMLRILKIISIGLISIFVIAFIAIKIASEKLPQSTVDGDNLARKMADAINKNAFDSLPFIGWNFNNMHYYVWNKQENKAIIFWDDLKVYMELDKVDGKVFKNGVEVSQEKSKRKYLDNAWTFWCNDSYWAFAPFKIFDKGTERFEVIDKSGKESLLVQYKSGGVTPGDAYLWELDQNFKPIAFKMWVKILPIKGIKATWDGWITTKSGINLSTEHKIVTYTSKIYDFQEGRSWSDFYEEWK